MKSKLLSYLMVLAMLFAYQAAMSQAVSVTSSTGSSTSASYSSLSAAFAAINGGSVHTGTINIRINSNVTETVSARLTNGGGNYTSISIRPADTATVLKTITSSTNGVVLVKLTGATNITIDGRAGGTGSTSLLKLSQTNVNAGNHTMQIDSSASNLAVKWVAFSNAATTNASSNVLFSTGPAVANATFTNNTFSGANTSIFCNATTGTPAKYLTFYNNQIMDFTLGGLQVTAGVKVITIDSNQIFDNNSFASSGQHQGIFVGLGVTDDTVNITRNHITNLRTSSTTVLGMFLSTTATVTGQLWNVRNNFVSMSAADTAATLCEAFRFQSTGRVTVNCDFNTFRVGGNLSLFASAAGSIVSACMQKSNSNANSVFNCKNNIFVNTRTGGVSGVFHATGSNRTPTTGTNSMDFNYHYSAGGSVAFAVWLNSVFSTYAGSYQSSASPNEQTTVFGTAPNFVSSTDLHLTGASIQDFNMVGTAISGVSNDIDNNTRGTVPYKGADESTAFLTNDATVNTVYTYGRVAVPFGNPHQVAANIKNAGVSTITSLKVYITCTGANSFTDSVTIGSLAALTSVGIDFPPHVFSNIGSNTITVTVQNDSNNSNNSKVASLQTTANAFNYGDFSLAPTGGVGFTGATGDFVAKFPANQASKINQISVFFNTGNDSVQIGIWSQNSARKPGTNLWSSATFKAPVGPVLKVLDVPSISVTDTFFCGVRQIKTTNIGFAYQTETPVRDSTFFFTSPTGNTTWTDFNTTASPFKFMIEPRLQLQNDVGGTDLVSPSVTCTHGNNQTVTFRIKNLGYDSVFTNVNNVTVKSYVILPNGSTQNFSDLVLSAVDTILPNATKDVTVSNSFAMLNNGTYKFRAYTVYGLDPNAVNDTVPEVSITVVAPIAIPFVQDFNTSLTGYTLTGFALSAGNGSGGTNSLRGTNSTVALANSVTVPKVGPLGSNSNLDFEYKITNVSGGGATVLSSQDTLKIQVSTDCGITFTTVATIDTLSHIASTSFVTKSYGLSSFSGQKIIARILSNTTATTPNNYNVDIDNLNIYTPAPMAYVSSSVFQASTANISVGSTNNPVIGLKVTTSGTTSPLSIASYKLTYDGTTSAADITNAKLYYTGINNTFSTATQVGSTIATPSGALVFIPGSPTALVSGDNYFWLSFDVPSTATVGNAVDATVTSFSQNGTNRAPSPNNPSGSRNIFYCDPVHSTTCGTGFIDGIQMGSINNFATGCSGTHGNAYINYFSNPTQTTNLRANNDYTFVYRNSGTPQIASIWIDYNRNGVYEASEWAQIGTNIQGGDSVVMTITIPENVTPGVAGMRIRSRFTGSTNGNTDACTSFGSGETEDYKVVLQSPCNWTGTVSTEWHKPGNWSSNSLPTINDNVKIPSGTPNSPTITGGATARKLNLMASATLTISTGGNLSIGNVFTQAGTLTHTTGTLNYLFPQAISANTHHILRFGGNGTYTLNGNLTVNNNFFIDAANTIIDKNGNTISVAGDATIAGSLTGNGRLKFSRPTGYITLNGNGSANHVEMAMGAAGGVRNGGTFTIQDSLILTSGTSWIINVGQSLTLGASGAATGAVSNPANAKIAGASGSATASLNILGNASAPEMGGLIFSVGALNLNRANGARITGASLVLADVTMANGKLDQNGFNLTIGSNTVNSTITATSGKFTNTGATGTLSLNFKNTSSAISNLKLDTMVNFNLTNQAGASLGSSFYCKGLAKLYGGTINLNGMIVTLGPVALLSEVAGSTFMGSTGYLQTTRNLASAQSQNNIGGLGLSVTTNIAPGVTYVQRGHAVYTSFSGQGIKRWFNFNPANDTGLIATLVFNYDSSELNGALYNRLRLNKSNDNGSNWSTMAGGTRSNSATATGWVSRTGVTVVDAGSYFTLSDSVTSPLIKTQVSVDPVATSTVEGVNVYPNPSNGDLNISFNADATENYTISIMDMNGKVISTRTIPATKGQNLAQFNLTEAANGLYFVRIASSTDQKVVRVVKN